MRSYHTTLDFTAPTRLTGVEARLWQQAMRVAAQEHPAEAAQFAQLADDQPAEQPVVVTDTGTGQQRAIHLDISNTPMQPALDAAMQGAPLGIDTNMETAVIPPEAPLTLDSSGKPLLGRVPDWAGNVPKQQGPAPVQQPRTSPSAILGTPDAMVGAAEGALLDRPGDLRHAVGEGLKTGGAVAVGAQEPTTLAGEAIKRGAPLGWKTALAADTLGSPLNYVGGTPLDIAKGLGAAAMLPLRGVFSRLERNVLPQIKVPSHANRILSLIKGRAAPEEAEARGLTGWLKAQGDRKVSPEEVKSFLEQHPLTVQETQYGGKRPASILDIDPENRHQNRAGEPFDIPARWNRPDLNLPGGENYREIVLHTPNKQMTFEQYLAAHEPHVDPKATGPGPRIRYTRLLQENNQPDYTSHAFPEKNILAWIRMDDRTLADGTPISFIQEMQSDWHQAGREKGYGNPGSVADFAKWLESHGTKPPEYAMAMAQREWDANGQYYQTYKISKQIGVPDAPFKGTGWQELAFDRAVVDAVDRGKKGIAWTTGNQQSERYGKLLTGVKAIAWDGKHDLYIWNADGRHVFEARTDKDVSGVIGVSATKRLMAETPVTDRAIPVQSIPGRAPEKFYPQTGTRMLDTSREPIQIGSKGMAQQYDTNVVNHANKIGKPFGAQVRDETIAANEYVARRQAQGAALDRFSPDTKETVHYLPFTPELVADIKKQGGFPLMETGSQWAARNEFVDRLAAPDGGFTVHAVTGHEPSTGFSVTARPDRGVVIPAGASRPDILAQWIRFRQENAALLRQPDLHIGGWHDPDTGQIFLDISKNVPTAEEAEAIGRANKEKAYFDHVAGKSVPIDYGKPDPSVLRERKAPGNVPVGGTKPPAQMTPEGWAKLTAEYPPVAHKGLQVFQNKLMDLSFGAGNRQEHLGALDVATGRQYGSIAAGDGSSVTYTPAQLARWKQAVKPLVIAHTHPSSSPFSLDDLMASYYMRREHGVNTDRMMVFAEDGGWYEMKFPAAIVIGGKSMDTADELWSHLAPIWEEHHNAAVTRAEKVTDQWVAKQFHLKQEGVTFIDPHGNRLERNEILAAHPEIEKMHDRHYRNEAVKTWETLAPIFGGAFKYYLAP